MVAIVGATASGKGRLAVAVARASGALLLSCDSMKVYRALDVGTAKPPPADREGVDWEGLDLCPPWESFSAQAFREVFEGARARAEREARPLLLVGGTMLYLKAATEGLDTSAPRDPEVRARLEEVASAEGPDALHARLAAVDPEAAARLHPNDRRRVIRALEVFEASGRPHSSFKGQFGQVRPDVRRVVFHLSRAREDMNRRIDERVERMFAAGWVDECRALLANPRGVSREAEQALGYRELFAWLRAGEVEPLEAVRARIQRDTRHFARRQLTWLRSTPDVRTLDVGAEEDPRVHVERVLEAFGELRGRG